MMDRISGTALRAVAIAALLVAASSLAGCGGSSGAPKTPEQARTERDKAFANASPDVKAALGEAEAAMKAQEDAKAFMQLNALSARPDLTAEQRGAAAQSMLSVSKKLDEAAAKGDREAAALLESYRASK